MLDFCKRNADKDIYIYGYYSRGVQLYNYLMDNGINVSGFIVSEGIQKDANNIAKVYYLDEINKDNIAIVLALYPKYYNDVVPAIVNKGVKEMYFVNGFDLLQSQKCNTVYVTAKADINKLYWDKEMSYNSSKKVFSYLLDNLNIPVKSVVDFGCGSGAWLKGIKDIDRSIKVLGLDGSDIDRSEFLKDDEFISCNLVDYKFNERKDLAMSLEVAEHLDEEYADGFIQMLCETADLVLFSAAIKNQGGDHHVNEQYPSYWQKKFLNNDYKCIDCIRPQFWEDDEMPFTFKQNMFLYVKAEMYDEVKKRFNTTMDSFSLVHPQLLEIKLREVYG